MSFRTRRGPTTSSAAASTGHALTTSMQMNDDSAMLASSTSTLRLREFGEDVLLPSMATRSPASGSTTTAPSSPRSPSSTTTPPDDVFEADHPSDAACARALAAAMCAARLPSTPPIDDRSSLLEMAVLGLKQTSTMRQDAVHKMLEHIETP